MEPNRFATQSTAQTRTYDEGLRAHMTSIYNRMTLGVLVTAITAFFVSGSPALLNFFLGGPQAYLVMLAPIGIVMFGFNPARMDSQKLKTAFFAISVLYGISLSVILIAYTGENIARAFFIAAGMFAGLSIFGYTTKKNLSMLGTFCVMAMWGLLVMSLLNTFIFKDAGLYDLMSYASIAIFSGLTAWETQSAKMQYSAGHGSEGNSRMAWSSALSLYISFIAIFLNILRLMGGNRG